MKLTHFVAALGWPVLFPACAALEGGGDVARGREAMFEGNYKTALGYFQDAEQRDPGYIYGTDLREGVLSYLGRAQYLTGDYAQARQTLEKALSQDKNDSLARLYLGLTSARERDRRDSLQEIDAGMKGIYDFLDNINDSFRFSFGKDWDPAREIRSAIDKDRAMIASGKIDWPTLIADGEWIAMKIEREPDIVRQEHDRGRGFRF